MQRKITSNRKKTHYGNQRLSKRYLFIFPIPESCHYFFLPVPSTEGEASCPVEATRLGIPWHIALATSMAIPWKIHADLLDS